MGLDRQSVMERHAGCKLAVKSEETTTRCAEGAENRHPSGSPTKMSPEAFISILRESHPPQVEIFTRGACLRMHLLLKQAYPEAEPFYDISHVVTKIGDRFYDINGDVTLEVRRNGHFSKLFGVYGKSGTSKAVRQMLREKL